MTTQPIINERLNSSAAVDGQAEQKISWFIPLGLLACVLLAFFDKISIAALFTDPAFQQAMGMDFNDTQNSTKLGLLMTAFLVTYGFSTFFLSGIGDKFHPVKILQIMIVCWFVLMLLMGFCHNYRLMVLLRILLGVAEGPLIPLAYTIIRYTFPVHLQARGIMLWLIGTPLGSAIGFPLSLLLLSHFGWQSTFFCMALLTLPLLWVTKVMLTYPMQAKPSSQSISSSALAEQLMLRKQLFKNNRFWLICFFNIAFIIYLWGMNGWLPTYLIKGKGIHLDSASWISSLPFVAMLIGQIAGAWLSDHYDKPALICLISLIGVTAALASVVYLSANYQVIIAMSLSMFMWGIAPPNVFVLLIKATHTQVSALAGGILNGLGNLSGALSPVVMGMLIARTNNMNSGLVFIVIVGIVGCFLILPLLKKV